jgi:glycosyltransferase involved in cell wall biosynthesis
MLPGIDLQVVVPNRWKHYGRWRETEIDPSLAGNICVGRVRWPWLGPAQYYLHWYPQLEEMMKTFRPDIIDLWEEPWGLVSAHACRIRDRLLPSTKVISETEQNTSKWLPPPFEQLRRYVLRKADFVVARSSEALGVVRGKGYGGPAEVVPNAVDTQLFRPMDRDACKAALGVGGFVVGYVGRLVPQKGLVGLVEAVARVGSEVSLVLVGDGPLKAELRSRGAGVGLGNRLRIIAARPLEDLPAIMNAFDVLVLPSLTTSRWKEQFGRVLIEANACGVPVIGSDSGAIPDVVGEGGLIVPEGDVGALARAISLLESDPARALELGSAGLAAAHSKYTWEKVADRMYGIYQRVVSEGQAMKGIVDPVAV